MQSIVALGPFANASVGSGRRLLLIRTRGRKRLSQAKRRLLLKWYENDQGGNPDLEFFLLIRWKNKGPVMDQIGIFDRVVVVCGHCSLARR